MVAFIIVVFNYPLLLQETFYGSILHRNAFLQNAADELPTCVINSTIRNRQGFTHIAL